MRRCLFFISLLLAGLSVARAQNVRWAPSDSGDAAELQLVFEDCAPDGDPHLPAVIGATFALEGTSTQTSIVNLSITRSTVLAYRVRSTHSGAIQIPAFDVDTNKGAIHVAAYTGGTAAASLDSSTNGTLAVPGSTFWAGEVFPVTYSLSVARRYYAQLASDIDWVSAPLIVEDWGKPEPITTTVNGEARVGNTYKTRAYLKAPGRVTLEAVHQLVNLQTGSVGFGLFQQPRVEQIAVTSNRPDLIIRPLPPGSPGSFNGAVGQFTLASKVVPATAAIGEPITWTLTLAGTGNWPDIPGLPAREVSKDFQVVQPQAKRTPTEGKLFDSTLTEDVVLVPTRAGSYTLGPVTYSYFDPKSSRYVSVTTDEVTVTVTAPLAPKFNLMPQAAETPAENPEAKTAAAPAKPPGPPAAIPRDPLQGSDEAPTPWSTTTLIEAIIAPFVLLLLFWLGLALRRARVSDPVRVQREARRRLAATLRELRSVTGVEARARLLLAWQHDTAILWNVAHAAPSAAVFHAGPKGISAAAWEALWIESDRVLYGPDAALPADWITRAEAALAAKRVAGFSPFQLFLSRNLFPFLALVLVGLLLNAPIKADPLADYRKGDFAAAEKSWRDALAAHPTDWIARHNLSLALAQQDHAGEAAAQAVAAFAQHPEDPSVRWHLGPAFEKAAYTAEPLAAFVQPGPLQEAAQLLSPAEWQFALVLAAALIALALGLWLLRGYGWRAGWINPSAWIVLSVALLLALTAAFGLRAYGTTADSRAVIAWHGTTLRSIPTEADTTQKTTTLAAGSVAIVDKTFLAWVRLSFDNGQTGWVRKEEVVPLWK
jgi:BatD DUF11 like domain